MVPLDIRATPDKGGLAMCRGGAAVVGTGSVALAAHALAQQFVYIYTQERQTKDLKRITNFVPDQ